MYTTYRTLLRSSTKWEAKSSIATRCLSLAQSREKRKPNNTTPRSACAALSFSPALQRQFFILCERGKKRTGWCGVCKGHTTRPPPPPNPPLLSPHAYNTVRIAFLSSSSHRKNDPAAGSPTATLLRLLLPLLKKYRWPSKRKQEAPLVRSPVLRHHRKQRRAVCTNGRDVIGTV